MILKWYEAKHTPSNFILFSTYNKHVQLWLPSTCACGIKIIALVLNLHATT